LARRRAAGGVVHPKRRRIRSGWRSTGERERAFNRWRLEPVMLAALGAPGPMSALTFLGASP
jgi:hypothetical protein